MLLRNTQTKIIFLTPAVEG